MEIISHLWQFMTFNHVLLYKRDTKKYQVIFYHHLIGKKEER